MLLAWQWLASSGLAKDLPSPAKTWEASKPYVLEPFEKRGELDQGILRFTWYSLVLVAKGYALGLLIGMPLGLLLGLSPLFSKAFDPLIQILRPVSPLAWLPLGLVLFQKSEPAALFTIAICSMWPTVLNTALGVRSIPQDYLNVARVLQLSPWKTLFKILIPATLPYMFTGFRLSLGIAWLVIVAAEMLTGRSGRRRLPVAGVQQPDLRAHHPVHPDHRRGRLRPRPADEPGGAPVQDRVTRSRQLKPRGAPMAFLALRRRVQGLRPAGEPDRGAPRHQPGRRPRASSSPSSATPGAGKTTLISLIAGLSEAGRRGDPICGGEPITGPGPDRGVVFQNYSLLPWMTVYDNVYLAVDEVFPDWPTAAEAGARRASTSRW